MQETVKELNTNWNYIEIKSLELELKKKLEPLERPSFSPYVWGKAQPHLEENIFLVLESASLQL